MEEENNKNNKKKIIIILAIIILIIVGAIIGIIQANKKEDKCTEQDVPKQGTNSTEPSNIDPSLIIHDMHTDKPIIYLYPTKTTEVTVKLGHPENLTCTYPKYETEWKVIANPNGNLTDVKTGRNLYCLYWEGINTVKPTMDEGFIVKGEDTISFLEEKLEILGLNEREANEFIIYWLPKLEPNKYNYIRFQKMEQIEENMPLEITPKPDSIIRIVMEYKALEEPIEITEQQLSTPQRTGFTAVEWGGTELK